MANEEAKLFVAGLPDSISEEVLKQLFEATGGKVVSVSLPKDRMTGRPRGFGFVTLATPAGGAGRARRARRLDAGGQVDLRSPVPGRAPASRRGRRRPAAPAARAWAPARRASRPGGAAPQAPDRTLYVGNLPYDATVEEVQTLINGVAPDSVVRVHLPMDADGRKRGFGFVTMASSETAKTAADALRTADLRGRRLIVNLAHPKGERPARADGGGGGGGGGGALPAVVRRCGGGGGGPSHKKALRGEAQAHLRRRRRRPLRQRRARRRKERGGAEQAQLRRRRRRVSRPTLRGSRRTGASP